MKLNTVWSTLCVLILISNAQVTFATVLALGNNTTSGDDQTFLSPVLAKVYDHPTGFLFLTTGKLTDKNTYAIAKAKRSFGANRPTFQPITPESFQTEQINLIALATSRGNTNPNVAFVVDPVSSGSAETKVHIMTNDGTGVQSSDELFDASGAPNANGAVTSNINNIAANQAFIFAAVLPEDSSTVFGAPDSGIAMVDITPQSLKLEQVPAQAGDSGIKAKRLDVTTPEVGINNAPLSINPAEIEQPNPYPYMVWDDILHRLFIGYDVETDDANYGESGARSIITARVNTPIETLEFERFAPDAAFNPGQEDNIIGVLSDFCVYPPCTSFNLSVHRIAVLHASTGPSYLIVNGGNGIRDVTGNLIFAIPLVDDPTQITVHGTEANKNSALVNGKFVLPALVNADLTTNTDPAALVGAGPFPFDAIKDLSDMVVVGDTVYASSNIPQSNTNEIGIFYSQAMFDETGKIIRWTPWTKRSFPFNGFPHNSPQVTFFDVDAYTGKIWAVGGNNKSVNDTIVRVTAWDKGTSDVSLVAQINKALACSGSYSVLDLDQSTRGFHANTCSRYALFGGTNKVLFAQVSQAFGNNTYCDDISNPQLVMTDYSKPENFLSTQIPGCGSVTTLEYSRRDDDTTPYPDHALNYFYAGTQNGFYVFANPDGSALDVSTFGNLNATPFNTGQWHKAPNITGAIIDIKTTGNMLYVLTLTRTALNPLQGTVYRIPFQSTVSTMFAPANIITIAQTNTSPIFDSIIRFLGMQIISTQPDGSTEQLVLASNRGLFKSSRAGGVQDATDQTDAAWQHISDSGTDYYKGIGGMHSSIPIASPSTVWPFSLQNSSPCKLFNQGSIYQLNGTQDAGPFNFVPLFFNSIETTDPHFAALDPISYFWSDGARRFFIIKPTIKNCVCNVFNALMILPFDTIDWNISFPQENIVPEVVTQSLYWVEDIGATGIVIAGTNKGVIGLE